MANRSKLIFQESQNKHTSRLIKAAQGISNLQDYTTKPQGVFGSLAIIKIGNITVRSDTLDIEFDIPFDDNLEANEGEIIVYNLSNNTIRQIKSKSKVAIKAGYQGDTGVIFKGYVTKAHTVREGADRVTTIKVIDDIGEKKALELSKNSGVKASTILKELLEKTGLPIAVFKVKRDWTYDKDVSIDETLEAAIKKYSEVCGVSTFTRNGNIYCCALDDLNDDLRFTVTEETGMIDSPTPFEEQSQAEDYKDTLKGYEVKMLLQHRMAAGALVRMKSMDYTGVFRVKSGRHTFNESECVTEIKIV